MSERKNAVIVYSDVVGYSALKKRDTEQAKSLLHKNHVLHRTLVYQYQGEIVKFMYDETLALFSNSMNAVKCAADILQKALRDGYALRIGIHEGFVEYENNELKGEALTAAMFLQQISDKGGIAVSKKVRDAVLNVKNISFEYFQKKQVESIGTILDVYKIKWSEEISENIKLLNRTRKKVWLPFIILGIIIIVFIILMVMRHI